MGSISFSAPLSRPLAPPREKWRQQQHLATKLLSSPVFLERQLSLWVRFTYLENQHKPKVVAVTPFPLREKKNARRNSLFLSFLSPKKKKKKKALE